MSDKFFVDTNILVYAHDRSAGIKHQRAQALVEQLWHSGEGVLSTQVLQELCVNLGKKGARSSAGGSSSFADTGLCDLGSRLQHSRIDHPGTAH